MVKCVYEQVSVLENILLRFAMATLGLQKDLVVLTWLTVGIKQFEFRQSKNIVINWEIFIPMKMTKGC